MNKSISTLLGRASVNVKTATEKFVKKLVPICGDNLQSIIVYGTIVKVPETHHSEINLMIVLDEVHVDSLDAIDKCRPSKDADIRIEPMVLTASDLRSSTDVFPLKFLDIQQNHLVLYGRDVMQDLTIKHDHIRLRSEQELKNLMLRLRWFYLRDRNEPKRLKTTLAHAAVTFLGSATGLLWLKRNDVPKALEEVARKVCEEFQIEEDLIVSLLALDQDDNGLGIEEVTTLYDEFMQIVQRAAHTLDSHEPSGD